MLLLLLLPAAAARRLRAGSGGLMRDDGHRGLPFNEDPAAAAEGAASSPKLANMSNSAKSVPCTRLRYVRLVLLLGCSTTELISDMMKLVFNELMCCVGRRWRMLTCFRRAPVRCLSRFGTSWVDVPCSSGFF
jgi:hypothetical protein